MLYVLGKNNHLQPIGVPGELCISGIGLARGYLKREKLTREKFTANPFNPGERMYRTGDYSRWLADGDIEYLGRMDHQVQIRGIRVELGEIENALLRYEGVKEAVVTVRRGKNDKIELCACVTADKRLPEVRLREYLVGKIPLYMLPTYFIQLERMPLTPNGKVDKRLLETIELKENSNRESNREAPRNPVENGPCFPDYSMRAGERQWALGMNLVGPRVDLSLVPTSYLPRLSRQPRHSRRPQPSRSTRSTLPPQIFSIASRP